MRRILVEFPSVDDTYLHRIRNFAEDLYRKIEMVGLGVVHNMDSFVTVLEIDVPKSQDLGRVMQIVRRQLDQHKLGADATIRRE